LNLPSLVWTHKAKQVACHFSHLDLFAAFGDPIAPVVAIDVLEWFVARISDAAMHLHGLVSGIAAKPDRKSVV